MGSFIWHYSATKYSNPLRDPSDRYAESSSRKRSGSVVQQGGQPQFSPPNRPQTRASSRSMNTPNPTLSPSPSSPPYYRPQLSLNTSSSTPSVSNARQSRTPRMNRSKTLYTIGTEVLKVAERLLPSPQSSPSRNPTTSSQSNRSYRQKELECKEWAEYADGVLVQLENELRESAYPGSKNAAASQNMVNSARSRCAQVLNRALLSDSKSVQNDDSAAYLRKGKSIT